MVEPFSGPGFTGEVVAARRPRELEPALERLTDPGRAEETLHWGRNYLYTMRLGTAAGEWQVVVTQFRNQTWKERLRRRRDGAAHRMVDEDGGVATVLSLDRSDRLPDCGCLVVVRAGQARGPPGEQR